MELAKEKGDEELEAFARRLSAMPPQIETNLHELRRESVRDHVKAAQLEAPLAVESKVEVRGGAVGLFDPERVLEDLAKAGRPRRDRERIQRGDVTWLGTSDAGARRARFLLDAPPTAQQTLDVRLEVNSGVVFVGPPEASDGPRLGTVRLDPFHTMLDEHLGNGAFVQMKPGSYVLSAHSDANGDITIYVILDSDRSRATVSDPAQLASLPAAVDATKTPE